MYGPNIRPDLHVGQVEPRLDYWAQWVGKRIQALQGKVGA